MSDFGDLRISDTLVVPAWELSEAFVRASGPGGQHVNKVSTAVQLTWHVEASSLPAEIKARFVKLFGSRLTNDGRLILEAGSHRLNYCQPGHRPTGNCGLSGSGHVALSGTGSSSD